MISKLFRSLDNLIIIGDFSPQGTRLVYLIYIIYLSTVILGMRVLDIITFCVIIFR